jgi:hypothetical protein
MMLAAPIEAPNNDVVVVDDVEIDKPGAGLLTVITL